MNRRQIDEHSQKSTVQNGVELYGGGGEKDTSTGMYIVQCKQFPFERPVTESGARGKA